MLYVFIYKILKMLIYISILEKIYKFNLFEYNYKKANKIK